MASRKKHRGPVDLHWHPSQDTSERFAVDQLLRSMGYTVYSRARGKETIWEKGGHVFLENDILCHLDPNEVADAEHRGLLYFEGDGR